MSSGWSTFCASSRRCSSPRSSPASPLRRALPIPSLTTAGVKVRARRHRPQRPRAAASRCPTPTRHRCDCATTAGCRLAVWTMSDAPRANPTAGRCGPRAGLEPPPGPAGTAADPRRSGSGVGGRARNTEADGFRLARPSPVARQGPGRREVFRAACRGRSGARRPAVPRSLQPRVPPRLRRVTARISAQPALGARSGTAALHRPLSRRHLLFGGSPERRLVHHHVHAYLCRVTDVVPGELPSSGAPCVGSDVRSTCLRTPSTQHVSRRQRPRAGLVCSATVPFNQEGIMIKIANTQLWVHDQDEALAFYTEKLGMEVRADVTLAEMGNFRWLTVGPAGQPEIAITLMPIPRPPMMDEQTAGQVRGLMAKGFAGTIFLTTDDCRASYEELKARGVEFVEEPEQRPYGIDSGFRDPSGNHLRLTQVTEMASV